MNTSVKALRSGGLPSLLAIVLLLIFVAGAAAQIDRGQRFSGKGECKRCHEDMPQLDMRHKHDPFSDDDCLACHKPHGMVGVLRLKETGSALCLTCHEAAGLGLQAGHVHAPAAKGKCLDCHDPHATGEKMLLRSEGSELCWTCHDAEGFQRKHLHEPLEKGCFSCHVVHGGDFEGLLLSPQAELCADCHKMDSRDF